MIIRAYGAGLIAGIYISLVVHGIWHHFESPWDIELYIPYTLGTVILSALLLFMS